MTEICTVTAVNGDKATVKIKRKSACDQCHASQNGKACGACNLFLGDDSFTADVENPIGAQVGDRVTVEASSSDVIRLTALLFILPLVCAGALYAAVYFGISVKFAPLGAIAGAVISCCVIYIAEKRAEKRKPKLVITRILDENRGNCDDTQ